MPDDTNTVLVPLSKRNFKGEYAIVDADDAERVLAFNWSKHSNGYAYRMVGRQCILLHRFILGLPVARDPTVDHINRVKLDDRKANLRTGSKSQNAINSKVRSDNTSGFRGVTWDKAEGKWMARIHVNGRTRNLGRFATAEEAARVRDAVALDVFGEVAQLNFPTR
jgi:hypothetical protein